MKITLINPVINGVECVTMRAAAVRIGCSYSRIAWLVDKGLLTAYIPGNHEKFIPVANLVAVAKPLKRGPKTKARPNKSCKFFPN